MMTRGKKGGRFLGTDSGVKDADEAAGGEAGMGKMARDK